MYSSLLLVVWVEVEAHRLCLSLVEVEVWADLSFLVVEAVGEVVHLQQEQHLFYPWQVYLVVQEEQVVLVEQPLGVEVLLEVQVVLVAQVELVGPLLVPSPLLFSLV